MEAARIKAEELAAVRELWREYWDSLGLPDDFQCFGAELAALPGGYQSILIEWAGGLAAGTVALRPLRDGACEMKRMYVRAAYRGSGMGRALLGRVVAEAKALGYTEIYADTLPSMTAARRMYRDAGFRETEHYAENPTPGAIFLRLRLR